MSTIFGKRETKKNLLRGKILAAAHEVFLAQGFESTTIGQIAERAQVGLGTAYNYFQSKEELFLLAMAEELENAVVTESERPLGNEDPADAVMTMLLANIKRMNFFGKRTWRVAMAALFRSMKSNRRALHELAKADRRVLDRIAVKLEEAKARGTLRADFSVETAIELIYGTMMLQVGLYIYMDEVTFEDACAKIEASIRFILSR